MKRRTDDEMRVRDFPIAGKPHHVVIVGRLPQAQGPRKTGPGNGATVDVSALAAADTGAGSWNMAPEERKQSIACLSWRIGLRILVNCGRRI